MVNGYMYSTVIYLRHRSDVIIFISTTSSYTCYAITLDIMVNSFLFCTSPSRVYLA